MLLNTSDTKILSLCLSLAPTHCKNNTAGLLHVTHCEIRSIGYNLFQGTQYHFSSVRLCDGNETCCSAQMKRESNIASRDMPSICVSLIFLKNTKIRQVCGPGHGQRTEGTVSSLSSPVYRHHFKSFSDWLVCGSSYIVRTNEVIHF